MGTTRTLTKRSFVGEGKLELIVMVSPGSTLSTKVKDRTVDRFLGGRTLREATKSAAACGGAVGELRAVAQLHLGVEIFGSPAASAGLRE